MKQEAVCFNYFWLFNNRIFLEGAFCSSIKKNVLKAIDPVVYLSQTVICTQWGRYTAMIAQLQISMLLNMWQNTENLCSR